MFPFHQGGELSFQISNYLENTGISNSSSNNNNNNNNGSNIYNDPTGVEQNVSAASTTHLHTARQHGQVANNGARRGRPRRPAPSMEVSNNYEDQGGNDVAQKRIIHREIERQRRQEMAGLYSSLRSLLPMEYVRGKRSICDHITEAARYIKDLEKNINELQEKKEKLKGSSSSPGNNLHGDIGCSSLSNSSSRSDCNVSIHTFSGAIEIEINAGVGEEDVFPLSRVLHVLIREGLNVVDCVSSKVNQRWIYVIRCEVSDVISIDSSQLQRRLMSEIGASDDS